MGVLCPGTPPIADSVITDGARHPGSRRCNRWPTLANLYTVATCSHGWGVNNLATADTDPIGPEYVPPAPDSRSPVYVVVGSARTRGFSEVFKTSSLSRQALRVRKQYSSMSFWNTVLDSAVDAVGDGLTFGGPITPLA